MMFVLTKCPKCSCDYMYDPDWEPQLKDMCVDCLEQEKIDQQDFLNDYNNEMFWQSQNR